MLPKLSQCTARFVYVLSPPVLHQLKCNLYHVSLCYRSFQMRYNKSCFMQTAIAPMTVKDRITKHWDSFGSHCMFKKISSCKNETLRSRIHLVRTTTNISRITRISKWTISRRKREERNLMSCDHEGLPLLV